MFSQSGAFKSKEIECLKNGKIGKMAKLAKWQNLSVFEYILDVNLVNLTNYKLNICEKKGNGTLI